MPKLGHYCTLSGYLAQITRVTETGHSCKTCLGCKTKQTKDGAILISDFALKWLGFVYLPHERCHFFQADGLYLAHKTSGYAIELFNDTEIPNPEIWVDYVHELQDAYNYLTGKHLIWTQ